MADDTQSFIREAKAYLDDVPRALLDLTATLQEPSDADDKLEALSNLAGLLYGAIENVDLAAAAAERVTLATAGGRVVPFPKVPR